MDNYLAEAFGNGHVQLFVGSGLSSKLYPSADILKRQLLDDPIYIDGQETSLRKALRGIGDNRVSLEDTAEYYELYQGEGSLIYFIKKVFGQAKRSLPIHENLWKLPHVHWIYTTNYDCLIEDALARPRHSAKIITRGTDITDLPANTRVVFKPHGCARTSTTREDFVITRNDYLNYSYRHTLERIKTLYDISTKVFLFLGYSLNDLNMRHIITEANRSGNVKSYAVLLNPTGLETQYWQKLGVTLIQQNEENFLEEVFRVFPIDESEWETKVDIRVGEKEIIAIAGLEIIEAYLKERGRLNLLLDAGSTSLYFARMLARQIRDTKSVFGGKLRVITNSPMAADELSPVVRFVKGKLRVFVIGGPFRYETRAYTPNTESARNQLQGFIEPTAPIISFIGATLIDKHGLKTRTKSEMAIKQEYIETSSEVYILVDHSKLRGDSDEGCLFASWDREKMCIVTDRSKEMKHLETCVREIRQA